MKPAFHPITAELRLGTTNEIEQLARQRGLSVEGLLLAQERGLLHFGRHWNKDAWFIADETRFAVSARRLDGQLWFNDSKAVMLKGTQGCWPIGIKESLPYPNIALVEGGPDLLAAHHLFLVEECATEWAAVAMLSATMTIPEEALPLFKGKHVRILYHNDPEKQGLLAACRWHQQLGLDSETEHFCCGGYPMEGGGVSTDLNDQVHASGEWYEEARAKNEHLVINTKPYVK